MRYQALIKAHEVFYGREGEARACYYDEYMKHKDWSLWKESVPVIEVMKLFGFVVSWDPNFKGDLGKFRTIYGRIYPSLSVLEKQNLIDIDLGDPQVVDTINQVFDEVARCPRSTRYESTDASKILHTLHTKLFVMWDDKIKAGILGQKANRHARYNGIDYARRFLPCMQQEAWEAVDSFVAENGGDRHRAALGISQLAGGKSLAKLIDEFNYVTHTLHILV